MTDPSSYGAVVLSLLKEKLGAYTLWKRIEPELIIYCSRIPQTNTLKGKEKVANVLKEMQTFLIEKGCDVAELVFLDEEIERFEKTVQLCKFNDKEDAISEDIIKKYAALTNEEGAIGIHLALNYEQLKRLTAGVYRLTKLMKFYISPEITMAGKITAERFEYPQEIPVITLAQPKDEKNAIPTLSTFLFGEKLNGKEWVKVKEIKVPFYIYRFITENNQEYTLLSIEKLEVGDYMVQGVITEVDDFKAIGESTKLPTKLPYLFVHNVRNRIIKFKSHKELQERLGILKVQKNNLFDFIFTVKNKYGKRLILNHPEWFKWMIWAWLTHSKQGLTTQYPLHILIIGDPNSGKSTLQNGLHSLSKEIQPLFSGVSSTMKDLVPSFKYRPAKIGYLGESNRFAFLDEFLKCVSRSRSSKDSIDEELTMMNDLLEHQKRRAGSGVSQLNVNMTARILATTNPIREIHNVTDLIMKFDRSFCSRLMIYYQPEEHVKMARDSKESKLAILDYEITDSDFISIIDYLNTFDATYDEAEVEKIYEEVLPMLSTELLDHYTARHRHHLKCLIDGIIKTRCIFDRDLSFDAKPEDYSILRSIWGGIIKSWMDVSNLDKIEVKNRINYLPENCQYLYRFISNLGHPLLKSEADEAVKSELTKSQYIAAIMILIKHGLIIERDKDLIPYWIEGGENEEQTSI